MDSLMNALGLYRVETKGNGMKYQDYTAAVERLRQLDLPDHDDKCKLIYGSTCYLPTNPAVRADKVLIYDAEHDSEPATVEWLREVGLDAIDEGLCARGMLQVLFEDDGSLALLYDGQDSMVFKVNPTRGDVLTALRLFGKKEGDA